MIHLLFEANIVVITCHAILQHAIFKIGNTYTHTHTHTRSTQHNMAKRKENIHKSFSTITNDLSINNTKNQPKQKCFAFNNSRKS